MIIGTLEGILWKEDLLDLFKKKRTLKDYESHEKEKADEVLMGA